MYSSSKGCVEIMSSSFRRCFLQEENSFNMATARAGNVIGGGDWAQDRLVPDCIRALASGLKIILRNPNSIRPWQHVLEPLYGYLLLGEKLASENGKEYAQAFNFGPEPDCFLTVEALVRKVVTDWGGGKIFARRGKELHEAKLLLLDTTKAKTVLNWHSLYGADTAVEKTVEWYKKFYASDNMLACTLQQIKDYERAMNGKIS